MSTKDRYRRVTDLYVKGKEVVLLDGTIIFAKALNGFEMQEARNDAQAARARMTLALKEFGSDELAKLEAKFEEMGREDVIEELLDAHGGEWLVKVVGEVQDDPEWSERVELLAREDENDGTTPKSDEEKQLLEKIQKDYMTEVARRMDVERDFEEKKLESMSDEDLRDEFKELWVSRRGQEAALNEYRLTEVWYGARECEAELTEPGRFDHSKCNGHKQQIWETRAEVRELPDELFEKLVAAMADVTMTPREGKDSGSPASSSDSSALPSEPEESTPSTPTETPQQPLGTSPSP